jgi:hypothetical protein
MEFDLKQKNIVLFEKTAMQLRSQRPLHVQGDGSFWLTGWWTRKEKEKHREPRRRRGTRGC